MGSNDGINYLAGNPILLTISAGRYRIYTGADYLNLIFEGSAASLTATTVINITELFEGMKEDAGVTVAKMVTVSALGVEHADEGNGINVFRFNVYGGGISKALLRRLNSINTDIFAWKIKSTVRNFFLTSRTNGPVIYIPENELMPLGFYTKGLNFSVKSNDETIESYIYSNSEVDSFETLSFAALRELFATSKNKLVNVFDVITPSGTACTIVITEARQTTDYFIRFKNTWGVWEKLALYGSLTFEPVFSEVAQVSKWDDVISDFTPSNPRKEISNSFTSSVGYRTDSERLFIIDMLMSTAVVLIANDQEYAVNISGELPALISTEAQPVDVAIKIEFIGVISIVI